MALLVSPDTFTKDRSHRVRHEEEVPNTGASATTKAKEAKKTARSVEPLKTALAVPSNIVAACDAPKEKPPIIQHDQPLPESAGLMVFPFEKQHVGSLGHVFRGCAEMRAKKGLDGEFCNASANFPLLAGSRTLCEQCRIYLVKTSENFLKMSDF